MSLKIEHIGYGFSRQRLIFKDLSLEMEPGKIYVLMGSNGTGKTTLFNLINGFYKASGGKIIYKGKDITGLQPFKINRLGIARTFQDLRLAGKLTVLENIILAIRNNPSDQLAKAVLPAFFFRDHERQLTIQAEGICDRFFLGEVGHSPASEISYGQQKLLTMACCVANDASLLLLDEPVAGIQPEFREKIAGIIKQLKTEHKTLLIIEHNSDFIADIADELFFLNEGQISRFADMAQLKADPIVMSAYI
jgi:branched-chain amino acid transport system ATP-binding protein